MVRRSLLLLSLFVCALTLGAETSPLRLPSSGCKNGTATAAIPFIAGASYAWTVDGGTIVNGDGTERITIRFNDAAASHVAVIVRSGILSSTWNGTIPLRAPLNIHAITAIATATLAPVTITWSYDNDAEPATQTLSGTDFPVPVVVPRG